MRRELFKGLHRAGGIFDYFIISVSELGRGAEIRFFRKFAGLFGNVLTGSNFFLKVLIQLGLDYSFEESKDEAFIPGRAVIVKISNKPCGVMGEVHPGVLSNFEIDYPVTLFEMGVEELV